MTEHGRIILSLMQLHGIGRKTICKYMLPLPVSSSAHCDIQSIKQILSIARDKASRVKDYSDIDISVAISSADQILKDCHNLNINIIAINESGFPSRLLQIDDPPVVLYYQGTLESLNKHTIAVIGTREPIEYGNRIAVRIGEKMAESEIVTVSGLALGCDTGGHTGTVNKGGKTIALLANGLETIYPNENQELAKKIINLGGCIISEYPPYAEILPGYFVDRDRLQAALSDAIFVVETDIKGGTMHTVEYAQRYGKRIYCFAHPDKYRMEPKTQGNQYLIKTRVGSPIANRDDIQGMIDVIKEIKVPQPTDANPFTSCTISSQLSFFSTDHVESSSNEKNIGFIFDFDNTLFDTDSLKALRDERKWDEIDAANAQPYPIVLSEFLKLIDQGYDVAVVSASPRKYCNKLLSYYGVNTEKIICIS